MVQVGAEGIGDGLVRSVEDALRTRELIKVRVLESAPVEAGHVARELVARIDNASVAQVIGRTVVLYRPSPEKPQIVLPD